jgi:hypothetical protein
MKHLDDRLETIDQLSISIAIGLELACFLLEDVEDSIGRIAILEGSSDGVCCEVYTGLFGILGQRGVEDGLKVGR